MCLCLFELRYLSGRNRVRSTTRIASVRFDLLWQLWGSEHGSMIFTAYLDESGTHAGAELSAMAGFVGDARQWRKFEKRAGKLFKRFRVDVFHTIDVRRTDKDFEGWS